MVHILLLILKIAGILILGILALLLAVLLCLLFVPVRYRLTGERKNDLKAHFRASWLLHLVSFHVRYEKDDLAIRLKLFGIPLWPGKEKKNGPTENEDPEEEHLEEDDGRETILAPPVPDEEGTSGREAISSQDADAPQNDIPPQTDSPSFGDRPGLFLRIRRKIGGIYSGFGEAIKKIKFSFLEICDKLRDIRDTAKKAARMIQDEQNRENIRFLFDCLKRTLRHIFPRKGHASLTFGFEDPSTTGQVLAWVSPFYPLYGNIVALQPVFDRAVLEGEGDIRGRIRLFTLLRILIQIRRNPDVWNMLKKLRNR